MKIAVADSWGVDAHALTCHAEKINKMMAACISCFLPRPPKFTRSATEID